MESLIERDVELKLAIKIESNSYMRNVKEVFNVLGRNDDGNTQYTSLCWINMGFLLRTLDSTVDITLPDLFVDINFTGT
jgi:hypothetical protein